MSLLRGLKKQKSLLILVIVLFTISLAVNIYLLCKHNESKCLPMCSYIQQPDQILIMESGIIKATNEFKEGEDIEIKYNFDNSNFKELLEKYQIEKIAGNGSEFEKAKNLMNEFAGRLEHDSYYSKYEKSMNALELLNYSLDNKKQGINCRAKAQILNEMCLALGIYARKVWLMSNSVYDTECHVVNEIWDNELHKWIMLDITENMYWVDERKVPLSVLEIRNNIGNDVFCTPVNPSDSLNNLKKSRNNNCGNLLYIAKNMAYFEYKSYYSVGESDGYYLMPSNIDRETDRFISIDSVQKAPENI